MQKKLFVLAVVLAFFAAAVGTADAGYKKAKKKKLIDTVVQVPSA